MGRDSREREDGVGHDIRRRIMKAVITARRNFYQVEKAKVTLLRAVSLCERRILRALSSGG